MANKRTVAPQLTTESLGPLTDEARVADAASSKLVSAHRDAIDRIYGDGRIFDEARSCGLYRAYRDAGTQMFLLAGAELVRIKEHTEHGRFLELLRTELDTEPRAAQRMMQAAAKFLTGEGRPRALIDETQVSAGKLIELLILDDDDLEAIERGERVSGIDKDDVANMSVTELRKALRAAREDKEADAELIAKKEERISKVERDLAKAKRGGVAFEEHAYSDTLDEARGLAEAAINDATKALAVLTDAVEALRQVAVPDHLDDIVKRGAALSVHGLTMQLAELLARAVQQQEDCFMGYLQDGAAQLSTLQDRAE